MYWEPTLFYLNSFVIVNGCFWTVTSQPVAVGLPVVSTPLLVMQCVCVCVCVCVSVKVALYTYNENVEEVRLGKKKTEECSNTALN